MTATDEWVLSLYILLMIAVFSHAMLEARWALIGVGVAMVPRLLFLAYAWRLRRQRNRRLRLKVEKLLSKPSPSHHRANSANN